MIKNILKVLLLVSLISCKDKGQTYENKDKLSNELKLEKKVALNLYDQTGFDVKEIYNVRLIGMEAVENQEEKNLYKKYSVDFTGACYSSDLCVFKMDKENITIQNYYDETIIIKLKIKKYELIKNGILITFDNPDISQINLVKIEKDISLYSFKLKGEINKDIRISSYLANEKSISKFGGIDCEGFDG